MWQIDLFGGAPQWIGPEGAPDPAPPPIVASDISPRQLDLTEPALIHRNAGIRHLIRLEVDMARREIEAAGASFSDHGERIREEMALVDRVAALLALGERSSELAAGIESLRDSEWSEAIRGAVAQVRAALHVYLGECIEREHGPAGIAGQLVAGEAFLLGGDRARAIASLERTLATRPRDARRWIALGNAHHPAEAGAARMAYLAAYLVDRSAVDDQQVNDDEVRVLASSADTEVEADDPRAWLPVLGVFAGLFAPRLPPAIAETVAPDDDGSRFFHLMVAAEAARHRGEAIVPLRRQMRGLSPDVFARYLEWIGSR